MILVEASGRILASGGGGGGAGYEAAGGGGGSGGGVLLEAPSVTVRGVIAANGGGGGAGNGGESGSDGLPSDEHAPGGPDPGAYAERGGSGSAAHEVDGETPPSDRYNGGGGGGGAGRVRCNTASGIAEVTGLVSPATSDTFSVGRITSW
jgi:hypothetical protein